MEQLDVADSRRYGRGVSDNVRIARIQWKKTRRHGKADLMTGEKIVRDRVELEFHCDRLSRYEPIDRRQAQRGMGQVQVAETERKAV